MGKKHQLPKKVDGKSPEAPSELFSAPVEPDVRQSALTSPQSPDETSPSLPAADPMELHDAQSPFSPATQDAAQQVEISSSPEQAVNSSFADQFNSKPASEETEVSEQEQEQDDYRGAEAIIEMIHESDPEEEEPQLLIQTQGLVKQYGGRRVVNGVDISVRAGEVVGLLGRNGAGKTTTFYMIVGLVPPTEGHVFMGNEDVTHMPMYRRARRGIGYLPQEESIFRKLTVEENLLAILETLPMSQAEREQRCDDLLQDFGLEHVRDSVSITLSGGEKRRVSIARALVTQPMLLMLDEPFSGVDPMAVHDIQQIILTLRERGLGVLITDHSVRETLSVVDRAYIIDEGRVLSEGTSEYLINDPVAREMYLGPRFSM